jgi:hypothetical protein
MEPAKTPQQRQSEDKADYEQEHNYRKAHKAPHCLKLVQGQFPYHMERLKGLSSNWEQGPNYPPSIEAVPKNWQPLAVALV